MRSTGPTSDAKGHGRALRRMINQVEVPKRNPYLGIICTAASQGQAGDADVRPMETATERRTAIAEVRLFRGLEPEQIAAVEELAETITVPANHTIFEVDEPGDRLYIVVHGKVRILLPLSIGGEEALAMLGPGEAFGIMSAIDSLAERRSATARSTEACTLYTIDRTRFHELLEANHNIGYLVMRNLVKIMTSQLRASNDKIQFLTAAGSFG